MTPRRRHVAMMQDMLIFAAHSTLRGTRRWRRTRPLVRWGTGSGALGRLKSFGL